MFGRLVDRRVHWIAIFITINYCLVSGCLSQELNPTNNNFPRKRPNINLIRDSLHLSHGSCLEFVLGDSFGAGWNGAELYIYDEEGNFASHKPNTTGNRLTVKYCYNNESSVLSSSILGSHCERKTYLKRNQLALTVSLQYFHFPSQQSIRWSAQNLRTGELYIGNFLTKMVFRFQNSTISLGYAQNLVSSPFTPMKWAYLLFFLTLNSKSCHLRNDSVSITQNKLQHVPEDNVTEMALYGFENTWFRSDGFGTTYEITDLTGSKVYFAGQLCSGDTGGLPCAISLEPGKYIWRVNGALDVHRDDIAWFFCDTQGGARSELFITIDESGKCIPGERKYSNDEDIDHDDNDNDNDIQEGYQPSSLLQSSSRIILLQGSFDLEGLSSQQLSDHEKTLLEYFIAAQFNELKSMNYNNNNNGNGNGEEEVEEKAKIHSWQEVVPYSYYNHEKGESVVIDRVTFTIPIHLDAYRAPGQFNSSTNELIANFKRYIGLTMSSGSFLSRLHHVRASNLQMITHVKFIDLIKLSEISPKSNTLTSDYSIFSEDFLLFTSRSGLPAPFRCLSSFPRPPFSPTLRLKAFFCCCEERWFDYTFYSRSGFAVPQRLNETSISVFSSLFCLPSSSLCIYNCLFLAGIVLSITKFDHAGVLATLCNTRKMRLQQKGLPLFPLRQMLQTNTRIRLNQALLVQDILRFEVSFEVGERNHKKGLAISKFDLFTFLGGNKARG
eukprot:gene9996-20794_t